MQNTDTARAWVGSNSGAPVRISLASGLYDRMQALYTGEVKPAGIDLDFIVNDDPRNIFNRMSATQEFDV